MLFEFNSNEMSESVEALESETPLGVIKILMKFSQPSGFSKLHIKKVLKYKNASVFILDGDGFYVEIVRLPINPKIPKDMKVDGCIAYLIRFKCAKKLKPEFVCALQFADGILEADPESGEGLAAQSFEHENIRLTIGTEDEEALDGRAKHQIWMPHRLFTDELISCENVKYIKDGIRVVLPTLEEETGQIQFVISWSHVKNNGPYSTWFAVDTPPQEILKQIGNS